MSNRGHTPVEVVSLLKFRDYDFVVRCLELVRRRVVDFAPECQTWKIEVIALCHHHPDNCYPALAVYNAGTADFDDIERFGRKANEWVRQQTLGWLLDASAKVDATRWSVLREKSRPQSSEEGT